MTIAVHLVTEAAGPRWRRGAEHDLRITAFDAQGRGVASIGDTSVHVAGALVGERVRARLIRKRGTRWEARIAERSEPSASARMPECAHADACGGCSFQRLDYSAQLEGLRHLVEEAFAARGLLAGMAVEPVVPAPETLAYRNKMEFTFSNRRWIDPSEPANVRADFALGLHPRHFYRKVIDVEACAIQDPRANAILASARRLALERRLVPWDTERHTGLLRHLVLRTARATGEILVNLVTAGDEADAVPELARALLAAHPEITTLVHTLHTGKAEKSIGESERTLFGPGAIRERVGDVDLWISARSFFQTNTRQAERLYAMIAEAAAVRSDETVYDLYCGAGSIALWLAPRARTVIGFESSASAVADARKNAAWNRASNVEFVEGDVLATLATASGSSRPAVCVVDPPRAGLHPRVLPKLAALEPARIVYVSCNPESGARDVAFLVASGYAIRSIRPIDLFPHTPHVECVIALDRTHASGPPSGCGALLEPSSSSPANRSPASTSSSDGASPP